MGRTCATCGGPIVPATLTEPRNPDAWVHARREDWADHPHNAHPSRRDDRPAPSDGGA